MDPFRIRSAIKEPDNSALYTLLLDLQPTDVKPPLGHFQHTRSSSKDEIFKLVQTINSRTDRPLTPDVLAASFEAFWPKLDGSLSALPEDSSKPPSARSDREILEEILSSIRTRSQEPETGKKVETKIRRVVVLIGFAEGVIKARAIEGSVSGRMKGESAALTLHLQGTEHELALSLEDLAESKKFIRDFIFGNTIANDDIPF